MKLFTLAALLLAFAVPAWAQTTPPAPAKTVTLRLKFALGQVTHLRATQDFSGTTGAVQNNPPMTFATHSLSGMTRTVQSVDANGNATLLLHIDSMKTSMNMNGKTTELPLPPIGDSTVVMSPTGKILSSRIVMPDGQGGAAQSMDLSKMGGQESLVFPDAPLAVGDTWSGEADMGQMLAQTMAKGVTAKMTMRSALQSVSEDGEIATIGRNLSGTFGGGTTQTPQSVQTTGTMVGTGTLLFNVNSGQMVSDTNTFTFNFNIKSPQIAKPFTMQGQMTSRYEVVPNAETPTP